MRSSAVVRAVFCACILVLLSVHLAAQSTTAGSVTGEVTAPDGSVVTDAAVALTWPDGPTVSATTNGNGEFRVADLPSGSYGLHVTATGFAAYDQQGLVVAVGRTTHVHVRLVLPTTEQSVTVSASETALDPSQTSSVVNIDRDRVEELPIPSRNFLSFVQLSPNVTAANPALTMQVPTASTPSFSFGGLRPGSNAVYIDDTNDNDEYVGSSRTQLSPEAINDFQIVNHGFEAESGGGAGGSIDVQTRAGMNRVHGDAFTFVQNGALNSTPALEFVPRKPDESRMRAGVAVGGPMVRDRTFYYVAAEQELARGEEASDLRPATISTIETALLQHGSLAGVRLQSGFFPTTDQETELSARIDQALTRGEGLSLRYAFTNSRSVNDAFNTDELSDFSARGSSFIADNSLNGTLRSVLSDRAVNRFSFEVSQRRAVNRTVSTSGPGVLIPGVAQFGTPYFGNDRRLEVHTEFAETMSVQRQHHLLQSGIRADRVAIRTDVRNGSEDLFVFASLAALQAGTPEFFTRGFGNLTQDTSETRLAAFAQDHWTAARNLTLDFGVRYDANLLPRPLPQEARSFAPRIGVAWTARPSFVLRAGFGLFYDRFLLATVGRVLNLNGTRAFTQVVEDAGATAIYGNPFGAAPIAGVAPSIWSVQPGLKNPYSQVASLGVEQALPMQTTLTVEYQNVRGMHLGRTTNVNLVPPVVLTAQNAASLGISTPTAQQIGRAVFPGSRVDPRFDAVNEFATSAGSSYNGVTVTVNRQFQEEFQIMAGYTYSKTMDDASSDFEQPQNPYALREERSVSLMDQRQRFTLSGLWLIGPDIGDPADAEKNANPGPWMKALTGLEFCPIVTIGSGFRANPVTGVDSNREHIYPFAARPIGYGRNSLVAPANVKVDLRVLRVIPLGREGAHLDVVAESFNVLNHRNVELLNPVYGSSAGPAGSFGKPIRESDPRRVQFSLDYEF